jgi:hypothetical protein
MSRGRLAVLLAVGVLVAAGGAGVASQPLLARGPVGPSPVTSLPVFPAIQDLQMTVVESTEATRGAGPGVNISYRAPDLYRFEYGLGGVGRSGVRIRRGDVTEDYFDRGDGAVRPFMQPSEGLCGGQIAYRLGFLEHIGQDFFVLKREALPDGARYLMAPRSLAGMRFAGAGNAQVRLSLDLGGTPTRVESTDAAGKLLRTFEFKNVRLNRGLPDDTFRYQPPPGVRVETAPLPSVEGTRSTSPQPTPPPLQTVGSLEEARALVKFSVFQPRQLPDGYRTPLAVYVRPSVYPSVEAVYADAAGCRMRLSQYPVTRSFPGEPVRLLDGTQATRSGGQLSWERQGTSIFLSGPLSLDELLATAASMR